MSAYQLEMYNTREYCTARSCISTRPSKVRGIKIDIHSGVYDNEFLAYVILPVSMFKEEALIKFVVSKSTQLGDYLYIFSKGEKSLKDIIRKNMKELV
jgi:hypothetical protein